MYDNIIYDQQADPTENDNGTDETIYNNIKYRYTKYIHRYTNNACYYNI